jgi:membrane protein required for colicin V production
MAALDWIFLLVLVASLLLGAWRGLVFETLSLAGWVAAFFAAQHLADTAGGMLPMGQADALLRHIVGFAVVFIAVVFAASFVAWMAKRLITSRLKPYPSLRRLGM